MKINLVPFIISFIACSLIAYTFYIFSPKDEFIYSITSFIISVCTIGFGIGFKSDSERITMLNRTVASVFFVICICTLGILLNLLLGQPLLIIIIGLELLTYFLIIYLLSKSGQ